MPKMGIDTFSRVVILDGAGHYLLLPSLTTTQRNALTAVNGMMIYNSTTSQVEVYDNGAWGAQGQLAVNTHAALATGIHGVGAGSIVGTDLTQTLTNKTLTFPEINEAVPLIATSTNLNLAASKASYPINRLAGVLATQSGWNTAPTNLANATDGDWTTATGLGISTAVAGYDNSGYIQLDMGAIYTVIIRALITVFGSVASQAFELRLLWSTDGSNWFPNIASATASIRTFLVPAANQTVPIDKFIRAQYIRLFLSNWAAGAQDLKLGIIEIQAIDLGV